MRSVECSHTEQPGEYESVRRVEDAVSARHNTKEEIEQLAGTRAKAAKKSEVDEMDTGPEQNKGK